MSTHPRLEARVSAQERRQINLDARIEELSEDLSASFAQLAKYHIQMEQQIDARFEQVNVRFNQIDTRFEQVDVRFEKIENRLDKIEATMATKEDLTTMENRILDAFKQLLVLVNPQSPPSQ